MLWVTFALALLVLLQIKWIPSWDVYEVSFFDIAGTIFNDICISNNMNVVEILAYIGVVFVALIPFGLVSFGAAFVLTFCICFIKRASLGTQSIGKSKGQ